MAMSTWGLST
uniref:Uncharacterized protein n=1 Tax=Anguilla anguilla TaxID=7936 RepID=A0A0E9RWX5_ANGAN